MDKLTRISQRLRRYMTKEERKLWYEYLKKLPITVKRQEIIGEYIVDFYCDQYRVIIELDGSQHYEDEGVAKDKIRDEYFKKQRFTVLRYSNYDIHKHFQNVCDDISRYLVK